MWLGFLDSTLDNYIHYIANNQTQNYLNQLQIREYLAWWECCIVYQHIASLLRWML